MGEGKMKGSDLTLNILGNLRSILMAKIDDIDTGNSNLSEEGITQILTTILKVSNMAYKISKYEMCEKLHLSRATFDNYVRLGKIPRGLKLVGFKELFWTLGDVEKFKSNYWKGAIA